MSGVAYRGVSSDQDVRFANKEKALLKRLKFPPEFSLKPDLTRVNWESIKPWISQRLAELMGGVEDDVVVQYVVEQTVHKKSIDPRLLQINITGFLEQNAPLFVQELWSLLVSAAETPSGVPQKFLDAAEADLKKRREEQERLQRRIAEERYRRERKEKIPHHDREPSDTYQGLTIPEYNRGDGHSLSRNTDRSHEAFASRWRGEDRKTPPNGRLKQSRRSRSRSRDKGRYRERRSRRRRRTRDQSDSSSQSRSRSRERRSRYRLSDRSRSRSRNRGQRRPWYRASSDSRSRSRSRSKDSRRSQ